MISDGQTMGTDGMRYSLPSRDQIADCIETMHDVRLAPVRTMERRGVGAAWRPLAPAALARTKTGRHSIALVTSRPPGLLGGRARDAVGVRQDARR